MCFSELVEQAHAIARAKGFWDKSREVVGVPEPFTNLKLGDEVQVLRRRTKDYGSTEEAQREDGGTVVQITDKFVVIKHVLGYTFCVSRADVLTGIKTLRRKGDDGMETPEVHVTEEAAVLEAPPAEAGQASEPAGAPAEAPPAEEEKLEFTKETVERLLAQGLSKYQIGKLLGLGPGKFYGVLTKWGLHEPLRGQGRGATAVLAADIAAGVVRRKIERQTSHPADASALSLAEAFAYRDRARAKVRCIGHVIKFAKNWGRESATEVLADLETLKTRYENELARIEAALEKVRVEL